MNAKDRLALAIGYMTIRLAELESEVEVLRAETQEKDKTLKAVQAAAHLYGTELHNLRAKERAQDFASD